MGGEDPLFHTAGRRPPSQSSRGPRSGQTPMSCSCVTILHPLIEATPTTYEDAQNPCLPEPVIQPQATPLGLTFYLDWLCFGVAPKSTASQSSFGSLLSLHLTVVCNCIIKMQTAVSALAEKDKHVHDGAGSFIRLCPWASAQVYDGCGLHCSVGRSGRGRLAHI